jgi:cysteine desulfurase
MNFLTNYVIRRSFLFQKPLCAFSTRKVQYLDYQATTPVDYRVLDAMLPYFTQFYGNPHSKTHQFGWDSSEAIEKARVQIASLINADPREIIFTSGATESNNMSLKGLAKFYGA